MTEALSPWHDLGDGTGFSINVLVELIAEWRITGGIPAEGYDWTGFDDACREHGGSWAQRWLRRSAVEAVILVVDPSYESSESVCELFADEGFEVLVAASGLEALNVARTQLPDVILLDLALAGITGEDVARALTRQECSIGLGAYGSAPGARTGAPGASEPMDRQSLTRQEPSVAPGAEAIAHRACTGASDPIIRGLLGAHPATRRRFIVGLSAHGDPARHRDALDAGCALVVSKPIDIPALLAWIRNALENG